MSIIKLEIRLAEITQAISAFKVNRKEALESLSNEFRAALSTTMNDLMQAEIDLFLGSPEQLDNKRNGYHPEREYVLKGIGGIKIRTPKDRKNRYKSDIIPSYERVDPRIKADMAILQLAGISTRSLSMISKRLLGVQVSREAISSSLELIVEEADRWLSRPLEGQYWALYIDGTNFNIQRRGTSEKEPSLVVLGVNEHNRKSILAIEPGTKDNAEAWRAVFAELQKRGLQTKHVKLGIMDGLPGLETAFKEAFSFAETQRCWVHSMRNTITKCPARIRELYTTKVQEIMYAPSEKEARKLFSELHQLFGKDAARAIKCLEKDLDSLLTYYRFNKKLWTALRTTNAIEAINKQFKRRTKTMDSIGETNLRSILVFVALKMEIYWQRASIDSNLYNKGKGDDNVIEIAAEEMNLLN